MSDDARVNELLKELLYSGGTPEEVCRSCPELLGAVRAGLQQVRVLQGEVAALFPESPSVPNGCKCGPGGATLQQIARPAER